jgi:hypothetical protein
VLYQEPSTATHQALDQVSRQSTVDSEKSNKRSLREAVKKAGAIEHQNGTTRELKEEKDKLRLLFAEAAIIPLRVN